MKKNILLFGMVLFSHAAYTAEPIHTPDYNKWMTMEYIQQTTPWLVSRNAAGLNSLKTGIISKAELYFDKNDGKFVNYNESDNSFKAGICAESYYRLNQNIVLTGAIDYSYFQGQNMGGSYLIDPYTAPFDIVDCNDNNRGKKRKESYHVMGGVSGRIHKNWTLGGKFDYSALNFTKQKDLRHTNHLMNLVISPSVIFEVNKNVSLGLDYVYQRKNEGISFQTFGTTDQIYNSLISYGAFWGNMEEFGTNGYTKGNEDKPLFNEYHGGDFQIDWNIGRRLNFFNELGYQRRTGRYGVESPGTIVHSNHNSHIITNSTTISINSSSSRHYINVGFIWEKLNNLENIYRYDNEGGGLQHVGYYGQLQTGYKRFWNLNVDYTLHLGFNNGLPTWLISGGYKTHKRMTRASYYPLYRIQELQTHAFNLSAQYNLFKEKNMYSFLLSAEYGYGHGNKAHDGSYLPSETVQTTIQTNENMLNREFEYIGNKQMNYDAKVKYSRQIKETNFIAYCSINYNFAIAPKIQYLDGDTRHQFSLVVGCKF